MKRKIAILVAFLTILSMEAATNIGNINYNLDSTNLTAAVTSGTAYSGAVVIPSTIEYNNQIYTVTSIENSAFKGCSDLILVRIPDTVVSIGYQAFYECTNLLEINLPESLTKIGHFAFYNCLRLSNITIPNSVTSIETTTFYKCTSFTSITLPDGFLTLGPSAFSTCTNLKAVSIGKDILTIDSNSFKDCYNLLDVYCYATVPPNINSSSFSLSTMAGGRLYVPAESIELYREADVWKGFYNIIPFSNIETKDVTNKIQYLDNDGYEINNHAVVLSLPVPEQKDGYQFLKWTVLQGDLDEGIRLQAQYVGEGTENNLFYLDKEGNEMHSHAVTLTLPDPEEIPGYIFQKWVVIGGDLNEGIHVQAQYLEEGTQTEVSSMMEGGSFSSQKMIHNGQVFILKGGKVFDVSGKEVK